MRNDFIQLWKLEMANGKKDENGLQRLADYYQSIFEIEENFNYYNPEDYLNAKRKFVKYLMKHRSL